MITLKEYNRWHVKQLTEKEYNELLCKELKMFFDATFKPRREETAFVYLICFVPIFVWLLEFVYKELKMFLHAFTKSSREEIAFWYLICFVSILASLLVFVLVKKVNRTK